MYARNENATYTRYGDHSRHLRMLVQQTEAMGGNPYLEIFNKLKKQHMEKEILKQLKEINKNLGLIQFTLFWFWFASIVILIWK